MRKSLDDIRRQYSGKNNDSGRDSTTSRSANLLASDQAIKEDEPPPTFNVVPNSEPRSDLEFISQPSTADFSKIDICSSVIADDLGLLYANETVCDIFSKSACNSTRDHGPSTDAFLCVKNQISVIPNGAPLELSSQDENVKQQSNIDFSKMDFSSSHAANNLSMLYTNESASKLFPGSLNASASDQGAPTTACPIFKKQTSLTSNESMNWSATDQGASAPTCPSVKKEKFLISNGVPKPLELSSLDEDTIQQSNTNFSKTDFSSSHAANHLNMLYTNESASKLFPGSLHCSASDDGAPTTSCHNSHSQTSPASNRESKSVFLGPTVETVGPNPGENNSSSCAVTNETAEKHEMAPHQLHPRPLSDGHVPSQSGVRNLNSQVESSIPQISRESFQKLMFNQWNQFLKPAISRKSYGGSSPVDESQPLVTSSLLDGQLTTEVFPRNDEINRKLPVNIAKERLGHADDFHVPQCNNGHPINLRGDNCGTVVGDVPVLETCLSDGRTKMEPQQQADSHLQPPSSACGGEKSKSHEYSRIHVFDHPEQVAALFEIDKQLPDSCSIQDQGSSGDVLKNSVDVLQPMVINSFLDGQIGQLASGLSSMNSEINKEQSIDIGDENLSHADNVDVPQCNNGRPIILDGGSGGTVSVALVTETSTFNERTPVGPRQCADSARHPPSSTYTVEKSRSPENTSVTIFKTPREVASSFETNHIIEKLDNAELPISCSVQETNEEVNHQLVSRINENTHQAFNSLWKSDVSEILRIDSNAALRNEMPLELGRNSYEKASERNNTSISYCGFVPGIHSTFCSTESPPKHPLRLLSVIPEESRQSGLVSQDTMVLSSSDESVVVSSIMPAADTNAVNPEGSFGVTVQEESSADSSKYKTCSQPMLLANSALSDLVASTKSTYFHFRENVSRCSIPLTARDTFIKALQADDLMVESRNIALELYGNCVDEPEICDLPTPKDYLGHNWFLQKKRRLVLGTSDCCYEGEMRNNKMHGHGRFSFGKDQYIEGKWEMNSLIEPSICLLTLESRNCTISVLKALNPYLISIFEYNFVAKAVSTSFRELDFNASVDVLKASFFGKFKIVEIINDELRLKRDISLKEFKVALKVATSEAADVVKNARILFLLSNYARNHDSESVLRGVQMSGVFPTTLQAAATNLLEIESSFKLRNQVTHLFASIAELVPHLDLREIMFNMYADRIAEHRRSLLMKCPPAFPYLMEMIQKLPAGKVLYITREDVGVFHHLLSLPCAEHHETYEYIQNLFGCFLEGFLRKLQSITTETRPFVVIPLISPAFGYLYKSFSEIGSEIVSILDNCQFQDLLCIDHDGNWKLKVDINWSLDQNSNSNNSQELAFPQMSKQKSLLYRKSLEAQYHSIFQMLSFFSPGNYLKDRTFSFEFNVLKFDPSWWQQGVDDGEPALTALVELEGLSNERLAWLYILDSTVHQLFKGNPRTLKALKLYNPLLQGYISFLEKSVIDTHESFRVLTHSIVQFLVSTAPYFIESIERPDLDFDVLSDQMWTLTTASRELELGPSKLTSFQDLIEEYNRYWTLRPFIDVKTHHQSPGYFTNQISRLVLKFVEVVRASLEKDVPIINLVGYLRSLNDFMYDFKDIDFLSCWYVKSDIYVDTVMEKIDNKLSSSLHCSYRVTNIDGFIELMEGNRIPDHYILLVVTTLIEYIQYCLNRSWCIGNKADQLQKFDNEALEGTGMLLDAIRQSFLYLKEQPEYVDFEAFKKESIEPFMRLVYDSRDLNDLKNRTNTVKESFWYIRNMDEIGIDQAIALFASVNDGTISDKLSDSYNVYLRQYHSYIETYCSHLRDSSSRAECLEAVRRAMKIPKPVHFSNWIEDFKTKEIPTLLAGLSAVWSILVSKDVSSNGTFLKPHCIQILCVMRLLSVDKSKGAENHLAQVLTGQGKSLILALLSSVLALTGHKVRVVCYSKYLSARDENDFKEFFQQFGIADTISYGTFQDMANGFLKPLCNGRRTNLRKMVCDRVLYHTDWVSLGSVKTESSDTVLLIDEVDVFFNDQFYGNYYDSLTTVEIPGLAFIQHEMWKIAKNSACDAVQVKRLTEKFISDKLNSGDPLYREWEAFRKKLGTFHLLVDDSNGKSHIQEYTNRSLTDEHLLMMAQDAVLLGRGKEVDHLFKLNEDGLVCMRNSAGQYLPSLIQSYQNTFAYFKLKASDHHPTNYFRNFGYLLLKTGKISYARLPCQFPLIMGVSGTLKDLSEYEKIGIDSYNIKAFSILPSFFGESSLKFNAESDFTFAHEQQEWLNQIYHKANGMVQSLRAVLIFFDSDVRLNLFAEEYKTKFNRVNEITLNTDSHLRDLYINEAGISCTVTLATRVMGRGLDYKSSLAVEKNGGIHVIQTFFSADVKEEIQIRGRTARKDNKGSYELIICKAHLIQKGIIHGDAQGEYTYSSLQPIRKTLMDNIGKRHAEMIMKSEHDHEITMMYYGLSQFDKTITETSVVLGNH